MSSDPITDKSLSLDESDQASKTPVKKKRGRPSKPSQQKKVRKTITLDPGTWERICCVAEKLGYEGVSTFINDIGQNLKVTSENFSLTSSEVPILDRVLSCGDPPSSRLWSVFSFIRLISLNLGLTSSLYGNEQLIKETARQAMTILCLRSYLEPDNYIPNVSGYTNWIAWHILQAKAGITEAQIDRVQLNSKPPKNESGRVDQLIWRLIKTIELLKSSNYGEYQIFQMHMMERLTGKQIAKLLRLREQNINESEALDKVKRVMQTLRKAWENDASKEELNSNEKRYWQQNYEEELRIAQKYLDILKDKNLRNKSELRKEAEHILLLSISTPFIDVLLREIDHVYCMSLSKDSDIYYQNQKELRNSIYSEKDNLIDYFSQRIINLKSKLEFAGSSRLAVYKAFTDTISYETGSNLPIDYLLNLRGHKIRFPYQQRSESSKENLIQHLKSNFLEFTESEEIEIEKFSPDNIKSSKNAYLVGCVEIEEKFRCGYIEE